MAKDSNAEPSPKCGGSDFGIGKQAGYAKMDSGRFNFGSSIIHIICTSCGYIIDTPLCRKTTQF